MDTLFEQFANISKAQGYDILARQVGELKEVIRLLIEVGELKDITFTDETDTKYFQLLVDKAILLSL